MPRKIVLAGEGGQGVQAVAEILALAAKKSKKIVTYLPSFGVEQRGGASLAYLQIGQSSIAYPKFSRADIIVCFSNRAIEPIKDFIKDDSLFIYDNSAVENRYLEKIKDKIKNFLAVPAQKIGQEKFSVRTANMVVLGAIAAHLKEIDTLSIEKAILEKFKDKIAQKPEVGEINLGAWREGIRLAEEFDQSKNEFAGSESKKNECRFSKEGISWQRFPEYCKGCGLCIEECPVGALKFSEDVGFLGNPLPIVDISKCIGCGKCQQICPDGAIEVENRK